MKCVVCSVGDTARLMPSIWRSAPSSACWLSAGNPVSEVRSRSGVSAVGSLEVRSWGSPHQVCVFGKKEINVRGPVAE